MRINAISRDGFLRLSDDVTLREEYFGGLVFHRQTGSTLEVDHEAYHFLSWLKQTKHVHVSLFANRKTRAILPLFLSLEILSLSSETDNFGVIKQPEPDFGVMRNTRDLLLSAPETVHLAVTYRCNEECADCYARDYVSDGELDTAAMCGIIDDIASQGVF
jgi:hypothetical protein